MLQVFFGFVNEKILVTINGNDIRFANTSQGAIECGIEGLKLDRKGVELEHPDLIGKANWKEEAIKRFKEKIKSYKTEMEKAQYIIEDLKKSGYEPEFIQRKGHRPKRIK